MVKIYRRREWPLRRRDGRSDLIQSCLVEAPGLPPEKRFRRFVALDAEDFIHRPDRSERQAILELHVFEGRKVEVSKQLIRLLIARLAQGLGLGLAVAGVGITLVETLRENWGLRGLPGDELALNHAVDRIQVPARCLMARRVAVAREHGADSGGRRRGAPLSR
jgi:hypothetical protein